MILVRAASTKREMLATALTAIAIGFRVRASVDTLGTGRNARPVFLASE